MQISERKQKRRTKGRSKVPRNCTYARIPIPRSLHLVEQNVSSLSSCSSSERNLALNEELNEDIPTLLTALLVNLS